MSEISFDVPKQIKVQDEWGRYKLFDKLCIKYLVRVEAIWGTDYYMIDSSKYDNNAQIWSVHTYLLPYQLTYKKIYSYTTTDSSGTDSPVTIEKALGDALSTTYAWSIGHIDDSLKMLYRSFEEDNVNVLDFINTICTKFNAVATWDTINNKVNMYDANTWTGTNRGLRISEKKYLSSLSEDINSDGMVTRLHCFGADTISLNSVNPTGQDYVENYTYFIGSFARDANKKVLSHSEWMSDSLCNALLDYQELISQNSTQFTSYLANLNNLQSSLLTLQSDLNQLNNDLLIIKDRISVYTTSDSTTYHYLNKLYNGTGWSFNADINEFQQYSVMVKSTNDLTCSVDGNSYSINSNWKVLKKISGQDNTNFVINSGQNSSNVTVIVCMITSDEYATSGNESALIEKYNQDNKQDQVNAKQSEIDSMNSQITSVENQITSLQTLLSPTKNFNQSQLTEWDNYINEDSFSDSNYTDANDLMTDGKAQLLKLQMPSDVLSLSIVNFLQIVECQNDWNKILFLNDIINIYYDNTEVRANLTQADIDFDAGTINLTIKNNVHVKSKKDQYTDFIKQTMDAAIVQNKRKSMWNSAQYTQTQFNNYKNNPLSANNQSIIGGLNSSEIIDSLGYKSMSDSNSYLRFYKGCILSTTDGGKSFNVLFSPSGLNAEQIIGQLMLDEQTSLINSDGSIQLTNTTATLPGANTTIIGSLPSTQIDSDLVNNATFGAQAKDQIDNLIVDGLGGVNYIAKNQCIGQTVDLTSASDVSHSKWGLSLSYNQVNGFTIPDIHIAGTYTISFVAYANKDNVDLQMNLNTNMVEDMVTENTIRIGTIPQIYQWVIDYNDPNLATLDDYLRFWQGDIEGLIVLTDIQLEFGKFRSSWRANASD